MSASKLDVFKAQRLNLWTAIITLLWITTLQIFSFGKKSSNYEVKNSKVFRSVATAHFMPHLYLSFINFWFGLWMLPMQLLLNGCWDPFVKFLKYRSKVVKIFIHRVKIYSQCNNHQLQLSVITTSFTRYELNSSLWLLKLYINLVFDVEGLVAARKRVTLCANILIRSAMYNFSILNYKLDDIIMAS